MNQAVDKSYRLLGARFLRKQAKRLASQLDSVCRGEEIEGVHQARVASRRLRAALEMFAECFPDDSIKRWRKEIRRITRGLGAARDKDVAIEFLAEHLAELSDHTHTRGIAAMLARLERDRARAQPKTVRVVERFRASGVLEELLDMSKAICARGKAKGVAVRSTLAVTRAEECLAERLQELYDHEAGLADPAKAEEHHAMRIAAKGLRYTVEMVSPVFGGELDQALVNAKQLQTLLGEVHDCDVWDASLDEFEEKMRRRTLKYFGTEGPFGPLEAGLEHLRSILRRRRSEVFDELCRFWEESPLSDVEKLCGAKPLPETESCGRCADGTVARVQSE